MLLPAFGECAPEHYTVVELPAYLSGALGKLRCLTIVASRLVNIPNVDQRMAIPYVSPISSLIFRLL